jgi:aryl-alcohol dehydrogenase-like predicted oxidoreductase
VEKRTLPGSELSVSPVAFGCEQLGGSDWGDYSVDEVRAAAREAWDRGVNVFDVADVYGLGAAESALAEALGSRRHDAVIVTKFGIAWEPGADGGRARTRRDASPRRVREALEGSLRRLRLERIPVYLVHWPDPATPLEATLDALLEAQAAGKILHFGLSNFPAADLERAHRHAGASFAELAYNLVEREPEQDRLPLCRRLGIGTLVYGPLAQGLLSGKYRPGAVFPDSDRRHRLASFSPEALARTAPLLDRLHRVAADLGRTPAQVALRWVLQNPEVGSLILGIKSRTQLVENLGCLEWTLPAEALAALDGTAGS